MKSQEFNKGELVEINVKIEKEIHDVIQVMSENAGRSFDEIVTIALRRYRSSHAELEGRQPSLD